MGSLHTCVLILGTINFSNAYYNSRAQANFQNISRNRRQTSNGSCIIPNNPPNGEYAIRGDKTSIYKEGDSVEELIFALYLKCEGAYRPSPPEIIGSFCVKGNWEPSPSVLCSRTCKSIRNTETTEAQCSFNNVALKSCENPVEGTVAKFTCEAFYEEPSLENNPNRFCENGEWDGIPQCYPICGQKHPVGRANVINGTSAKLDDYPWHVGVYSAQKEYRCGGAIITQRIILSAAHCFTDLGTGELHPKEDYLIAVGKYYRNYHDSRDEYYQYATIDSIHIPSRYKGSKLQFQADIAVVVLAKQLTLTEAVQPVCVDWSNKFENQQLIPNSHGVAIGWGYTKEGPYLSNELKELSVSFIPFDQCFDNVPRAFQTFLRSDQICGKYLNNGTSVCEGDGGGALVFPKRCSGRYFIRGISSTSPPIERPCDSNQYGIYTLVSEHLDFINSVRYKRRLIPNTFTVITPAVDSKPSFLSFIPLVVYSSTTTSSHNPSTLSLLLTSPPVTVPSTTTSSHNDSTLRPRLLSPPVTAPLTIVSNLGCLVPTFADYGIHTVQSSSNLNNLYQAGDLALAEPFDVLTSRCNGQTSIATSSVCVNGSWTPKPSNCSGFDLLPTTEVCGISQSSEYGATNSSAEANSNEFPWLVTLVGSKMSNYLFLCRGVLINNRYVLTTAFCPRIFSIYAARLGIEPKRTYCLYNGSSKMCEPSPLVPITAQFVHEDYSLPSQNNDIGLVRLERAVDFTDRIKPICLPLSNNSINRNFENTSMLLAGWPHKLKTGEFVTKLTVPVKANNLCSTDNETIDPKIICAEGIIDTAFCYGVQGTALMKFEQDGDRSNWYAFAIWSQKGCLTKSRMNLDALGATHSRLDSYIPWILDKIKP